eukprot:3638237-Pleurochrysis_carterae.AAC.1
MDCNTGANQVFARFFGKVVPSHAQISVTMLHAVEYLGDAYHAFSSWVLHESLDQVHLGKPALAR